MRLAYDFHIHSCLSPCGDEDMTPGNIVGMAALAGLDAVALTDHNTCGNVRPFLAHAQAAGLLALPGMELTTREEVHVVCLFPDAGSAEAFSAFVRTRLPPIPNRPDIFGEQTLMNERDEPCGTEERLLISAADIGIYDVCGLVSPYDGVAFPAHIDRSSFSLLSNLGLWDPRMGFTFAERTASSDPAVLPDVPYLINSDAHRLEAIPDAAFFIEVSTKNACGLIDAIRKL